MSKIKIRNWAPMKEVITVSCLLLSQLCPAVWRGHLLIPLLGAFCQWDVCQTLFSQQSSLRLVQSATCEEDTLHKSFYHSCIPFMFYVCRRRVDSLCWLLSHCDMWFDWRVSMCHHRLTGLPRGPLPGLSSSLMSGEKDSWPKERDLWPPSQGTLCVAEIPVGSSTEAILSDPCVLEEGLEEGHFAYVQTLPCELLPDTHVTGNPGLWTSWKDTKGISLKEYKMAFWAFGQPWVFCFCDNALWNNTALSNHVLNNNNVPKMYAFRNKCIERNFNLDSSECQSAIVLCFTSGSWVSLCTAMSPHIMPFMRWSSIHSYVFREGLWVSQASNIKQPNEADGLNPDLLVLWIGKGMHFVIIQAFRNEFL